MGLSHILAKMHSSNQAPSAISNKLIEAITSNRTHLFCEVSVGPKDAQGMNKGMGREIPDPE